VADLNYREPRGNPRSGGRYVFSYSIYDDRDLSRYSFRRFDVDLQQYFPMFQQRRVIALRAMTSMSDADAGQEVPFYLMRTLGGPDDLRGFRQYRFRDRNLLLLQAEYRWEVFTAMDAAIFYDAGKVSARRRDLNFDGLERDYGIGMRFGGDNGVFLRVEGAFGSRDGKHLVLRFGNVF
jgi:outer membrane protein assembly factor BamA